MKKSLCCLIAILAGCRDPDPTDALPSGQGETLVTPEQRDGARHRQLGAVLRAEVARQGGHRVLVNNAADPVAAALLDAYQSDAALADTYVGYSGSPDLTTAASYARIDGPRVWIEVTIQGGIVYRDRVHYHTIWRDKVSDYGAEYVSP